MSIPAPLPRIAAFEKMGFGMFLHWGLYSQLGAGEWVQAFQKIPFCQYRKLADTFTAEDFNADAIAALAARAGMKYIVLTTRHHDGFSLYDTCGLNDFDALHTPAKRDLIAEFVEGCRRHGIVPFFYHTTMDWYWRGKNQNDEVFSEYTRGIEEEEFQEYLDYLCASVELLCKNYGKIGGLWFDGNWSRPNSDWQESRLYGMIRRYQPDAIIVNNTGLQALGKTGHPEIDSVTYENNAAKPMNREGMEKYVASEVCKTMNAHWGLGKNDINFLSPVEVVERLCHSRGCGANFLLNFGPTPQGGIPDYEKAVLELVARWMKIFGSAIYERRLDHGVVYGAVAVGMIMTQHVTYRCGGFAEGLIMSQFILVHRVQNSAVYGLETVADVGKSTTHDDAHGVVDIALFDLPDDIDIFNFLTV